MQIPSLGCEDTFIGTRRYLLKNGVLIVKLLFMVSKLVVYDT